MAKARPVKFEWFLYVLGVGLAGWLIWRLQHELTPFILAGVLAYILHPPVERLVGRGGSRPTAILAVYVAAAMVLAVVAYLAAPAFFREAGKLARNLPGYLRQVEVWRRDLESGYRQTPWPGFARLALDRGLQNWGGEAARIAGQTASALVLGLPGTILDLVLAPVLGYYLLRDGHRWGRRLLELVPAAHRGEVAALLAELDRIWGGFLRGQLAVAAIVAGASAVALHLLGVRFSLLLGILSGLGDLVPYLGPVIGAVAAAALALERSPLTAALVVLFFLVLHWAEENLLSPRLLGDRLGLHPAAVIVALLVGGELGGLWGLFLAVPVAGMLRPLGRFLRHLLEPDGPEPDATR